MCVSTKRKPEFTNRGYDMRYIQNISQIRYATVSRKVCFGKKLLLWIKLFVVCHFYFTKRQISHCIACSTFFLKSGHLIPSGMYSEWEPVFSSQINLKRFQVAGLHIIGCMEMESKISDTFNDITSFTMALLVNII